MSLYFSFLVAGYFFGRRRRRFDGFPRSRRVGGGGAKLFPVVAIVTDEVRDLAEGLVRDDVLKGHGGDGSFWKWMKKDADEDLLFCV